VVFLASVQWPDVWCSSSTIKEGFGLVIYQCGALLNSWATAPSCHSSLEMRGIMEEEWDSFNFYDKRFAKLVNRIKLFHTVLHPSYISKFNVSRVLFTSNSKVEK
jgi:hypothetical protein